MNTPIDISKLRLQDSGELIEGLQRSTDPKTSFPATAKVLKDHRDNLNSLLGAAREQDAKLTSLTTVVNNIVSSPSSDIGVIAYA